VLRQTFEAHRGHTFEVGVNELRCEKCHQKAVESNEALNALGCILTFILHSFGAFCAWNIWIIGQESKTEQEIRQKVHDRKP
jgi:hypothetical protein